MRGTAFLIVVSGPAALWACSSVAMTAVISSVFGNREGYRCLKLDFVVRQKGQRGEVKNKGAHTNTVPNKTHRLKYIIYNLTHLDS